MISVVIPCYKVKAHILNVIDRIGDEVDRIYVVDDLCPEGSGKYVAENCMDLRVKVVFHEENKGVGGAMVTGYRHAIEEGFAVVVKIDGDGQMDPALIKLFIKPIIARQADYTKGNRFFDLSFLSSMPRIRLFGNAGLSLVNKVASGYWDIMDPTNGYTAIHSAVLRHLPLHKLDNRYFFESDMLFRLGTIRAKVLDIPMDSTYGNEVSSLNIRKVSLEFPGKYLKCFIKRIFYNYFLRDFNAGTIQLIAAAFFIFSGLLFGLIKWYFAIMNNTPATSGVVMLAALPILFGFQLLLSVVNYDISRVPQASLHDKLIDGTSLDE